MSKHLTCLQFSALFFVVFSASNLQEQDNYTINGVLSSDHKTDVLYLTINQKVRDSTKVQEGHFTFMGKLDEPTKCLISVKGQKGWASFILENGISYELKGKVDSIWKSKISGSKEIELTNDLNALLKPGLFRIYVLGDSMNRAKAKKDSVAYNRYKKAHMDERIRVGELRRAFILKNKDSYTSLFTFEELRVSFSNTEQKEVFAKLSTKLKRNTALKTYNPPQIDFL
jgi:hypothetical protein